MEKLMSLKELCDLLDLKERTVYDQIREHRLPFPYIKLGKKLRFRQSQVLSYIADNTVTPRDARALKQLKPNTNKKALL